MPQTKMFRLFMLVLALVATACVRADRVTTVAAAADGQNWSEQAQKPETTVQSFTTVNGGDLKARLDAASQQARGQSPYWSAYSFDVRPGVAVDPTVHEFHGNMNTIGDTTIFIGTSAGGMTVETRNLAVFLLRQPGTNQVNRMEIYNLERKREYSGYPVYWLGRANNEESLNYLQALSDGNQPNLLGERAVLGISLHDDVRVGGMLKNFVRSSTNQRVRSSSIYWLGQVGGEQNFLADIVRNDSEDRKLRRQAAHAIGESKDRGALALLQTLYDSVKDTEVHRSIVQAAGDNQDQDAAFAFILRVAKSDSDREARRTAVRQLGEFDRPAAVDELIKIYTSDADYEVKRTVLHSLAETKQAKAQTRLLELARTEPSQELRKQAIHVLSERGAEVIDDLIKLYDAERAAEVRKTVLHSLAEIKDNRVEDKLFAVARNDENVELRRQAIHLLGERAGKRSLDFLSATAQGTDGDAEVQMQAVRAISERPSDEAVPLLIKIARTHPNQMVRKQAIRALGESGDPRAVEYFKEVLTKE
ncbi:MAG TPA: HEAT repeat domain-containing protein [Pyrinomonadaceae bacterium]|nr:HEAT repeat domain-containing protein [Pyrinomonadaceae bacterium]